MRLALVAAVLLAATPGCRGGAQEVYTFERGAYDPDRVPGIKRLDEAAAAGDPDAQFEVAFARQFMTGKHAAAVVVFERLAAEGHLRAIGMLAYAHREGKGVAVDHERSAYWLERAAALGDDEAARDLAAYRAYHGARQEFRRQ